MAVANRREWRGGGAMHGTLRNPRQWRALASAVLWELREKGMGKPSPYREKCVV